MKSDRYPNKKIIVITGTPGVGKTVVSEKLAVKLGAYYVSLTDIVKDENLISGVDDERKSIIVDMERLSKRTWKIIHNSLKDVIVEGHYASDVVPSSLVSHIIVLRRDPEELKAEFEARGYDERKVSENMATEILDVCLVNAVEKYGLERVDEIDVTKMSVDDVVEEVSKLLDGRRKPRMGLVDWLSELDKDGRLDEILSLLCKG